MKTKKKKLKYLLDSVLFLNFVADFDNFKVR